MASTHPKRRCEHRLEADLPELLAGMRLERLPNKDRVRLESDTHGAGVRLDYDDEAKRWLVTAYERRSPAPADVGRADAGGRDASPGLGDGQDIAPTMKKVTTAKRGDFYEIEGEHARGVAKALDVGVTYKRNGIDTFGMPAHAARLHFACSAVRAVDSAGWQIETRGHNRRLPEISFA